MSPLRACSILLALTSLSYAGGAKATLTALSTKTCSVVVVSVDARVFKSPQHKITLTPGRHLLSLRVTDALGSLPTADASLDTTFEAHDYTFHANLSRTGALDGRLTDLTKEKEQLVDDTFFV
jgi:hypothetical protein